MFTTKKPCLQHGFARITLGWDTQWCIKPQMQKFLYKHWKPDLSTSVPIQLLFGKTFGTARIIYFLYKFNFQTSIISLFIRFCLNKWHCVIMAYATGNYIILQRSINCIWRKNLCILHKNLYILYWIWRKIKKGLLFYSSGYIISPYSETLPGTFPRTVPKWRFIEEGGKEKW